ncbi:MAG: hypothetical protein AAF570_04260 [Bacteroidota bacterium]
MGYLIMGTYVVFNTLMIFLADQYPFGPEVAGPYSIYSSKSFFIVYHVWGMILCLLGMYAMWKEIRTLFMIVLFLLLIVMFYPWFTASPADRAQGRNPQKEKVDTPDEDDGVEKLQYREPGSKYE